MLQLEVTVRTLLRVTMTWHCCQPTTQQLLPESHPALLLTVNRSNLISKAVAGAASKAGKEALAVGVGDVVAVVGGAGVVLSVVASWLLPLPAWQQCGRARVAPLVRIPSTYLMAT